MKIEKLETRLSRLLEDPGDTETLERILRMVGDELPRYRSHILNQARSRLAATATRLSETGDRSAIVTGMALRATCTLIASYQTAAAERHCALCTSPLGDHYVLSMPEDFPDARLCGTCITEAIRRFRPEEVRSFEISRTLDTEPDVYSVASREGKPGFEVRLATYRRNR